MVMFPKDMDQAAKMLNMRIKIDVWSNGLSEDRRRQIRETLGDLFCQLPPRRIWLYLKRMRLMLRHGEEVAAGQEFDASQQPLFRRGEEAEDIIVEGWF